MIFFSGFTGNVNVQIFAKKYVFHETKIKKQTNKQKTFFVGGRLKGGNGKKCSSFTILLNLSWIA
jgi:hypothetical protein